MFFLITHHYFTSLRDAQTFPLARSLSLAQAAKVAKKDHARGETRRERGV
jgi:hypothetical protein